MKNGLKPNPNSASLRALCGSAVNESPHPLHNTKNSASAATFEYPLSPSPGKKPSLSIIAIPATLPTFSKMPAEPISFQNTYAHLPERFYSKQKPAPVPAPQLIASNSALATELGIAPDWLTTPEALQIFSGNTIAPGSEPLAQAYAGHQFGGFSPQLGDGRALLLGEVHSPQGQRDIQLKGSGRTPFSRRGDGKSALGPVLREYLLSEAMHALGVPTTRALAAISTGETVYRQEGKVMGGVFTRIAASHLRVGTFQYFAARNDREALRTLTDYTIARHYPAAAEASNPPFALLQSVIAAQALLIPHWMSLGFIHGVMNTDN